MKTSLSKRLAGLLGLALLTLAGLLSSAAAAAAQTAPQPVWALPAEANDDLEVQERHNLRLPALRSSFPRLEDDFQVLGPSTRKYNCMAHALGLQGGQPAPHPGARPRGAVRGLLRPGRGGLRP